MADAAAAAKNLNFVWEGTDKKGNRIKGKTIAPNEAAVNAPAPAAPASAPEAAPSAPAANLSASATPTPADPTPSESDQEILIKAVDSLPGIEGDAANAAPGREFIDGP